MNDRLAALADAGVSIWLDDLSRELLRSGDLQRLLDSKHVVGVTTNPTIFASALAKGNAYDQQLREAAAAGKDVDTTLFELTTTDVRDACDVLRPVYDATGGVDGRVSIEVDPCLAQDTDKTTEMARALHRAVDRPNVMIKIPATTAGLPAITQVIADGISVNITLIFALDRYRQVMQAYLRGLELAHAAGGDLRRIHSVASFFVSRVDTEVDARLDALGTDQARALRGRAALANARLAYHAYEQMGGTDRWLDLVAVGANLQRPLWASTGVKDPAYPDTMYVTQLVTAGTVNTMPSATMDAFADHGQVTGDTVRGTYHDARRDLDELEALGIRFDEVTDLLERQGLDKFDRSWNELSDTVGRERSAAS
jgi:transaldolase